MAFLKNLFLACGVAFMGVACSPDQSKSLESSAASGVPGYKFAMSCEWKYIGDDSGTEQNCDSLYVADKLTQSDVDRISANLAAKCLNNGASAKKTSSVCQQKSNKSCKCEGKVSQVTKNSADADIYLLTVRHWPEANSEGIQILKNSSSTSALNCNCTADVK